MVNDTYFWGTGRRKSSVARVRLRPGNGEFLINSRQFEEYFTRERDQAAVRSPLTAARALGQYDIYVNVQGGGPTGQSGAVLLGIARALCKAQADLEEALRDGGYLTRDARMVERKKYGRRGARRGCQFSKR